VCGYFPVDLYETEEKLFFAQEHPTPERPHGRGYLWLQVVPYRLSAAGAHGINRPGEMVRNVEGLTTKVLNECLRKNLEFGILEKQVFKELPPRVEYRVTPFGERFMGILEQLESLQQELESGAADSV
jgi:DNA-binding HxlR family transcriptional regulator